MAERSRTGKLGLSGAWAMAVGGMVGGGVFSVMGLVFEAAGAWAPLAFVLAGAAALLAGLSYCDLTVAGGRAGGIYEFMQESGSPVLRRLAGAAGWLLAAGYTLTVAVYAFVFGEYVGHVFGLSPWGVRGLALVILAGIAAVNFRDTGSAALVEVVTVWGKLAVLVVLAGIGLSRWAPGQMTEGASGGGGLLPAALGAATIFMAYEGWQLLAYDYDDMERPERTLRIGIMGSIVVVAGLYVAVAAGAAMLVGAGTLIENNETALAQAGRAAAGQPGLIAVTIAAGFSAASAINATLFSTARLMRRMATDGELPGALARENRQGQPWAAVTLIAAAAAALTLAGSLSDVVEAASAVFLLAFGTAGMLAFRRGKGMRRALHAGGAALCYGLLAALVADLVVEKPAELAAVIVCAIAIYLGHGWMRRRRPG